MSIVLQTSCILTQVYKTYGIQVFNQSYYEALMYNWTKPGGCKEQIKKCQDALQDQEPISLSLLRADATKKNLSDFCTPYVDECGEQVPYAYLNSSDGRGWFDIAHPKADPFPLPHMYGYLLEEQTLAALGVPVNWSFHSLPVMNGFVATHDIVHGGYLDDIAQLLDGGVKVHLMYGDRDYACNWIGGEKASLAVPYSRAADFAGAGYSPLLTPDGVSGMTRQFGNFSFTRVYQAGHEVPTYQPAAAYEIFMRATFNRDVATGLIPVTDELATLGPHDTWFIKNVPPEMPKPVCYILKPDSCLPEVWKTVENGTATVKDWFVVEKKEDSGWPDEL